MKNNTSELFKCVKLDGVNYQMGASVRDVKEGDLVKLVIVSTHSGPFRRVLNVDYNGRSWIVIDIDGKEHYPFEIAAYGKMVRA